MRHSTLAFSILVILITVSSLVVCEAEDMVRLEKSATKQRVKIAKEWLALADTLAKKGYAEAAKDACMKAEALDPEAKGLDRSRGLIDSVEESKDIDDAAKKVIAKAKGKIAKGYEKLAKVFAREPKDPRSTRYLIEAYLLSPSKARLAKVAELAKKAPLLFIAPGHPMAAHITFPKAWKAGRTYPVLVSVDGAGANFRGNANTFRNTRGSRAWITVAPHALSCTNVVKLDKFPAYSKALVQEWNDRRSGFDIAGLVGILDFLHEHFGAEEKVAITGFSGGGNLCYGMLLQHPERIRCAAPACANFNRDLERGSVKAEDGGAPVHIMTGEKDPHRYLTHGKTPPGIEEQTDQAEAALKKNGYEKVKRTMLPGVGHAALAPQVWAFLDEVVGK